MAQMRQPEDDRQADEDADEAAGLLHRGSCGRRPMMKTSMARMATITTTVMTQA